MITTFKISNIILHIVLISLFIIIIFLTYGISLEKIVLKNQIEFVTDKFLTIIKKVYPNKKIFTEEMLQSLKLKDSPEEIKKVDNNNNGLIIKGSIANGILLFITIVIIVFIGLKYQIKLDDGQELSFPGYLGRLTGYNLITLFFVACTYFGFITYIAYNYIYIDDSYILVKIIDKIEKKYKK